VRDTEALVRRLLARLAAGDSERSGRSGMERDPDIKRLEGDLADKLGAKVELVQGAKGKGKLVISYHSLDELDGILAHIR
jgi:ParB family chromosome partitioning protein